MYDFPLIAQKLQDINRLTIWQNVKRLTIVTLRMSVKYCDTSLYSASIDKILQRLANR